jgi:transcriptional regulator with XRE-family HTH domain
LLNIDKYKKWQVFNMATLGEVIKEHRKTKGLSQSEFGQQFGIIMTEISKIENGRKKFPFSFLESLAEFLEMDFNELKNLYVAEKLVEEVRKYECSDEVFMVAESQSKYLKTKVDQPIKMNSDG